MRSKKIGIGIYQLESSEPDALVRVTGARVHNLKNVSLSIPRNKLTVLTGLSGSGKSSLAFDTLYVEGQRRYVESLSNYARQFLDQYSKPDCDDISGLSPTISIEQKSISKNPRSTVGTLTELWDYLRLLYARLAKPKCYQCGSPIQAQNATQIVDQFLELPEGCKLSLLSPIVRGRKGEYQKELLQLRQKGFVRVRVDGEMLDLSEQFHLDKNLKHDIEVFVDRLIIKGDRKSLQSRLHESVELGLKLSDGLLIARQEHNGFEYLLSDKFACQKCQISYPAPEPRTFSFNSPIGQCPTCEGLGVDPKLLAEFEEEEEEGLDSPGLKPEVTPERFPCKTCNGDRLSQAALSFRIMDKSIAEFSRAPISEAVGLLEAIHSSLSPRERLIVTRILEEMKERMKFLEQVGVGYLSLSRPSTTLSGGEAQRIRLATQIGSALVGVIYVLDEPSIGLHQSDNDKLLESLKRLRDLGNTVVVVEHDEDTIRAADWVIDLGPGAGVEGGEVIAMGTPEQILESELSLTAKYLRNERRIEVPLQRRKVAPGRVLRIEKANLHNLKIDEVEVPLGLLTCVTGVSGSGKSSLILETLYPYLAKELYGSKVSIPEGLHILGTDHLDKVIDIDQTPIGRTPRSNPATYTGIFTLVRELFAQVPESKARGYKPGRFSFNVTGGRCEECEGDGMVKKSLHFLPDLYIQCESCLGKRYHRETLEILYRGKSIADVLDLSISESLRFFEAIPQIRSKLQLLQDVGLGYLKLGQSATTLSGGEAQRMKLSKELSKRATGRTLYILDEPSTGLHFEDIRKLLEILHRLVDQGNTVIVIEHNLDIIKTADHVIDMGPEGGSKGGRVLAAGTPEDISKSQESLTAKYLRRLLPFHDGSRGYA